MPHAAHSLYWNGGKGMYWFMDSRFAPAYTMADTVIEKMNYNGGFVEIDDIMSVIKKEKNVEILLRFDDFSKLEGTEGRFRRCGAAMSVPVDASSGAPREARIMINSLFSPEHRRFSMAHELGHLMTDCHNCTTRENRFRVSMHIDADITCIDEDLLDEDEIYVSEQIANIFALLVLMPKQAFVTARNLLKSEGLIAHHFGVETDAVYSRIKLLDEYGK